MSRSSISQAWSSMCQAQRRIRNWTVHHFPADGPRALNSRIAAQNASRWARSAAGIPPGLERRAHADLRRVLVDLGAIDVSDDLVPLASSSARTLAQLRRDARGDVIEVGPAGPEQRDLPFALGVAHRLLSRAGPPCPRPRSSRSCRCPRAARRPSTRRSRANSSARPASVATFAYRGRYSASTRSASSSVFALRSQPGQSKAQATTRFFLPASAITRIASSKCQTRPNAAFTFGW